MTNHEEYSILVVKEGDYFVGLVLEVPGALAWSKTKEGLKIDLGNAIRAIHRATKEVQELTIKNNKMFANAKQERMQLC